jgi:hypothetical protein
VILLRVVHGDIGAFHQRAGILGVKRAESDAHARVDLDRDIAQQERGLQCVGDLVRHTDRAGVSTGEERDCELVAAQTRHGVAVAESLLQPAADLDEEVVAEVMAQRVVDLLEAIEVHHDHPDQFGAPACVGDGLFQPIEEERAVRESGQRVVRGLKADLLFAFPDPCAHAVEGGRELSDLVVLAKIDGRRVIALLDPMRAIGQSLERAAHTAREYDRRE